jgi:hypothetical protein
MSRGTEVKELLMRILKGCALWHTAGNTIHPSTHKLSNHVLLLKRSVGSAVTELLINSLKRKDEID